MKVWGDSKYVIGLWNKEWDVRDVFLFNCVQLALDVTTGWERSGGWIPRTENEVCDALARQAVATRLCDVWVQDEFSSL